MILAGCRDKLSQSSSQTVDKVYTGVVPCADCSGIETTVLFKPDGTFIEQLTYLGKQEQKNTFYATGNWTKKGSKFLLLDTDDQKTYFQPSADGKKIEYLDQEGNKIESNLNYTLEQVKPEKKSGEYSYIADTALFKECKSGRTYSVSGIDLEKGYSATGVEAGRPVYVEIEGYYTIRPSMEDGMFDTTLIQTGSIKFDKLCACQPD
ncbi:MAG: copper resistance protein NlpE N-terminal domain-containing protein [Arsenophonus endosymbiont of Dermacentor nuttalli]